MTVFFQKIMMNLNLPVYYKQLNVVMKSASLVNSSVVRWIMYSITPSSSTLDHLQMMMGAISSYFHSTGEGREKNKIYKPSTVPYKNDMSSAFTRMGD